MMEADSKAVEHLVIGDEVLYPVLVQEDGLAMQRTYKARVTAIKKVSGGYLVKAEMITERWQRREALPSLVFGAKEEMELA